MEQCKTYRGETTSEALLKVKMDLGEGAEIVETREVKEGGLFGFFRDTFVEVEAWKPEPGAEQRQGGSPANISPEQAARTVTGNSASTARNQQPAGGEPPARNQPARPPNQGASPANAGSREWNVNEPAMPDFSPRDKARRLIEERQEGQQRSSSDPGTYRNTGQPATANQQPAEQGSTAVQTSPVQDTDTATRQSREISEPEQIEESVETSDPEVGAESEQSEQPKDKMLEKLMTNTDLLSEKLDSVLDKVEGDAARETQPRYPGSLDEVYERLQEHGVQEKLARDLIGRVRTKLEPEEVDQPEQIKQQLVREIDRDYPPLKPLDSEEGTVIAPFIGPTGVGKTTTLAKLAAHFSVNERKDVGFITLDTYRLAAVEQLKRYADILKIPLKDVIDQDEFHNAVRSLRNQQVDMIFVDTAGRSQFDEEKLADLRATFQGELDVVKHLVVSANSRFEDVETVLEGFGSIGYDRFIVTKIDETTRYGLLYNLLREVDDPIAYVTDGQEVPNDLQMASPELIADLLLDGDEL